MKIKDEIHSFSRKAAKQYGVSAAIVLGYIGHRVKTSKNVRDGKRWFYTTLDELTERYPYLGRSTIHEATKRLTAANAVLVKGNYNRRRKDLTTWYAFRDEQLANQLGTEPCYFKASEAKVYGIAEAVLMNNLRFWLKEKQKKELSYRFHPLSPTTLAQHLPFSISTIKRALIHLVEARVLVQSGSNGDYGLGVLTPHFADSKGSNPDEQSVLIGSNPDDGSTSIGSKPDEVKTGQGSIPDWTSSNPDMTGPKADMRGSIPDDNGSNPDDVTILITHLEDNPLKDESLKDNHFKASVCFSSSNSPESDSAEVSSAKLDEVTNSGDNGCFAPVVPSIQDLPKPEQIKDSLDRVAPPLSSAELVGPSTAASQAESSAAHVGHPDWPEHRFLDAVVHKCCWEVLLLHNTDPDATHEALADHIEATTGELIRRTGPDVLYRLYKIETQVELNAELAVWSADYFVNFYETNLSMPDLPNNANFREMFINHAHCFLNMAFHSLKFEGRIVYVGLPHLYRISLEVFKKISPWAEAKQDQQRQEFIRKRAIDFASPDQSKENDPNLSAAEKMQVFNQSLQAKNRVGRFDEWKHWSEDVVVIQSQSLALTRQFFQLNPGLTPAHLNLVLDECLKLPREVDGLDPMWYAKNGYKISFLLKNLGTIAAQLNLLSKLPAFTPLSQEEE